MMAGLKSPLSRTDQPSGTETRERHPKAVPTDHDMLEWIPDAVLVCDGDGRITFVNRQAEAMTGYRRKELIGQKVERLVPVDRRGDHVAHRRRFYQRGLARSMGTPDFDFRLRRKDGTVLPVDIALGPVGAHTIAVIRDITERRLMEDALERRALHDPLTALANRNLFFDRLRQALLAARRNKSRVALVMLDLDHFKAVNDAYGHATGDHVLEEFGRRLSVGQRATDTAARIGGDEFAWILPMVSGQDSVLRIVRKRLAGVQEPVEIRGHELNVGISAGIAIYPEDGRDLDTLMRHADEAMYSAKRQGLPVAFHLGRRRRG